ncbi:MAG: hypothetical protein ACK559_05830, partial [bacterium]
VHDLVDVAEGAVAGDEVAEAVADEAADAGERVGGAADAVARLEAAHHRRRLAEAGRVEERVLEGVDALVDERVEALGRRARVAARLGDARRRPAHASRAAAAEAA